MKTKILNIIISIIIILVMTSCKQEELPEIQLMPTDLITMENAQQAINNEYMLVLDKNGVVSENNKLIATYLSDPIGAGYPIKITLYSPTDTISQNDIKDEFNKMKDKRSKAITVEGLSEMSYIAYPSIHLYEQGYHIEITAGSGNDDKQRELLVNLGQIALSNLNNYIQTYKK